MLSGSSEGSDFCALNVNIIYENTDVHLYCQRIWLRESDVVVVEGKKERKKKWRKEGWQEGRKERRKKKLEGRKERTE